MPQRLRNNTTSIPDAGDIVSHQAEDILLITKKDIMAAAAAEPVVPVEDVWKTTPFSGDFNPGTKLGSSIFLEKTKILAEADCLALNKANSLDIHKVFWSRERINFKTPTQFNAYGTVKSSENILTQYHRITLENVQCAAIAQYNVALAVADPISPPLFSMKTINPGKNGNDKRKFYNKVHIT